MAETKITVIYPRPTDVGAFEKKYVEEHVPLAVEKIKGMTKFAATKVVGTPDGSTPPFYRIAELYPFNGGAEGIRCVCRNAGSSSPRFCDFDWRPADHFSG